MNFHDLQQRKFCLRAQGVLSFPSLGRAPWNRLGSALINKAPAAKQLFPHNGVAKKKLTSRYVPCGSRCRKAACASRRESPSLTNGDSSFVCVTNCCRYPYGSDVRLRLKLLRHNGSSTALSNFSFAPWCPGKYNFSRAALQSCLSLALGMHILKCHGHNVV